MAPITALIQSTGVLQVTGTLLRSDPPPQTGPRDASQVDSR